MAPNEPAELLLGASQAGLETFDRAEPAFRLGCGDSGIAVGVKARCSEAVPRWKRPNQ
ncbi:hypothetical protein IGW14_09890 [Streptomyces hygroscopicus subsp. hygroscopicus]|uniref:Uncharacterized protein n=1 Tax=Streptomyces demainii TaxID=588122 RepID=A0ABT9L651_9ACTN|nr:MULTISPECIES: hypothetical protein [Streptomyces]MBW8088343.1 hypothetical protein [Streptomyces hygroscopicus subsp. hygroscopicus]MDP9616181.1 hypothetical protein [Streptomyces demainii]